MKTKTITPFIGDTISSACGAAVEIAIQENCNIEFEFNGQKLTASPESDPEQLEQSYSDECERRRREYIASPEYKAQQEDAASKERDRKAKVESILEDGPDEMTLADPEGWERAKEANSDPYGGAVITYAERWARLMEARIAKGERLEDVAEELSFLANEEGISGFMHGAAVATLSHVWIHGKLLRKWRNAKNN